jgi:cell division protein FtsB
MIKRADRRLQRDARHQGIKEKVVKFFGGRIASALVGISLLAIGSSASAQDYSKLNVQAAVSMLDVNNAARPLGPVGTLASTLARPAVAATTAIANAARLHLKAMKKGDEAFFYHSMSDKAVVGIMRIAREAAPDPKDREWVSVRVEPVRAINPVTLAQIKAEPSLSKMELIRQSRLSVAPVRDDEWARILQMAGESK